MFHKLSNDDNRIWVNFTTVMNLTTGERYITRLDPEAAVVAAYELFKNGRVIESNEYPTAHELFEVGGNTVSCGDYSAFQDWAKWLLVDRCTDSRNLVLY